MSSSKLGFVVTISLLLGASSAQFNSNPAVSELKGATTLSWQIPAGGLGLESTFHAISPVNTSVFLLIPPEPATFVPFGVYKGRVEFSGNLTSSNITFTLRNISSADAGTYRCGNGDPDQVISECGQMLVVLGKPTRPPRPSNSTTPVYTKRVTLTCTSTSTSLPADHGLTLTYTWMRDGTIVNPKPGTSFTFNVTSRDPHNFSCSAAESRGLKSEWSDVYRMEPEYGPYQKSLTPPGLSYTVRENQTTVPTISCSANCKPACTYCWEKNGTMFSNSAVLNLGQSSRSQTGSYRCRSVNDHGSVYTSSVSVNVQYHPEVHITTPASCRPYRVFVGQQNVQLVCEVKASNPEVTSFTWRHNNSVVSSAFGHVLTINTISEKSSGSYSCQGNNGISGPSVSQSLTLDVQYGPRVSIPAVSPVVEGSSLTVRCSVDANPTASVSWTKRNSSFTRTGSVLQFTGIQRDEAGEYVCSATNTISPCGETAFSRSGEEEVTVAVQYRASISEFSLNSAASPVTVGEGDTVTLKCQVDSNPPATIRLLNGTQELKRGDKSLSETHTWQTTCRQRGNYSCMASNSVGPVASSNLELAVKCSPRPDETYPVKYRSASRLGSSVTLWMSVLSYPVPTFTWSRSNSSSWNLTGSLSVLSAISVNISLTLTSLRKVDFGLYNLAVTNGIGADQVATFEIFPQGPPDLPTNVQVREITPNSALVSWTRGFNGGDTQAFTVSSSTDNTTWINSSKIEEDKTTDYYDITLSMLNPSTSYTVRVIAGNRFGDSKYTEAVLLETKADPEEPESTALIAGVSGGCAALLLIAIGAGGVYMYRRNKGNKDQQNGPSNGRSREDLVMQENDLYGRSPGKHNSELVMEENVCYVSSGEVGGSRGRPAGGATGGVSEVYAAVDKKPKLKDTSAKLDTQVKPKKAAKPGKKDKDKNKNSKDDTIPLTKKKQNKRGDVYENTSPGQFLADADANTYANAGFVGDNHTSDETAAVQAPPTGRDADGCLYVGIDFGNQKPGKVIIGDEKSPYADIAFGRVGPPPAPDEDEKKKKETETASK